MTGKLIVVSNRIPGKTSSGGLVVALQDAISSNGGIWIGAHADPGEPDDTLEELGTEPYRRLAFHLSAEELENYYLGFANSVLWPLCHRRGDLVQLRAEYERDYLAVNRRVARMVAQVAEPDDLIWIHDYHFLPLAEELRKLHLSNRMGFFLHIPFPSLADLSVLPDPDAFAHWLAQYNLLGLQTSADVARCLEMFRSDQRAEFMPNGSVKFDQNVVAVRSFPIGIDVDKLIHEAETEGPSPFGREEPEEFIIGVDRLDYSKGIPNRFRAFGEYLDSRPPDRRPCLVQIAPPSRERVKAYRDITFELEEIAGRLNGEHAALDWTPIRYIHRSVERSRLARLYRRARACLVTSLADGMNLVAKEYIAAQDPEDPGVLILSRFAGAAEDMQDALLVNPYDTGEIARAIAQALDMPLAERQRRYRGCMAAVRDTDVSQWSKSFLAALRRCTPTLVVRNGARGSATPDAGPDQRAHSGDIYAE
ncbi:trehalose-6-phosphate synthase [Aquicoccus sp. SCR17]|nr:trehalose-6-phosphate synthase [Carideicomes alvinocaridis]